MHLSELQCIRSIKMRNILLLIALLFPSSYSFVLSRTSDVCNIGSDNLSKTSLHETKANEIPELNKNKFQSDAYDKPIVLLGCSGAGNELYRLGSSIATMLNDGQSRSDGDVIDGAKLNEADIINQLEEKSLDRSKVIVIDFSECKGPDGSKTIETLSSLSKSYYEEDLLTIYTNVHPDGSEMSPSAIDIKEKMEESVFIKYSDYEICIKDEGLDTDGITSSWEEIEWQAQRLLARAFLPLAIPGSDDNVNSAKLSIGKNTFFLSLSFPEIMDAEPYMETMNRDVDAMEFRADLLSCRDDRFELLYSLQKLREMCR